MKIRLEKMVPGKPVNGEVPMINVAQPVVLSPALLDYAGAPTRFEPGKTYDVPDAVAAALAPFGAKQV